MSPNVKLEVQRVRCNLKDKHSLPRASRPEPVPEKYSPVATAPTYCYGSKVIFETPYWICHVSKVTEKAVLHVTAKLHEPLVGLALDMPHVADSKTPAREESGCGQTALAVHAECLFLGQRLVSRASKFRACPSDIHDSRFRGRTEHH